MRLIGLTCGTLLAIFVLISCVLLVRHITVGPVDYAIVAALLLVAVLGLEGVVALSHLGQARSDSRVDSLKELMRRLESQEFLDSLDEVFKGIPWQEGHLHDIGGQPVAWKKQEDGEQVTYCAETSAGEVRVSIDRQDKLWRLIHVVAEGYQEAGFLCEHGRVPPGELLRWAHLPILRFWGRVSGIVELERARGSSPFLWHYIEALADRASKR